jgi:hypothetical protein
LKALLSEKSEIDLQYTAQEEIWMRLYQRVESAQQ